MTDDQVYKFVTEMWDNRDRTIPGTKMWEIISEKLEKKGHVSSRTGRPLNAGACRSLYYNFERRPALSKPDLAAQLKAMRAVAALRADDSTKLKLLLQMIGSLEG
jgi:hypothetical protein